MLENLELWSLFITLVIITIIIFSFGFYDLNVWKTVGAFQYPKPDDHSPWEILTILGGTLIVVQGFETTRYLGNMYSDSVRIKASRWSQVISTAVYLIFVALALPLLHTLNGHYNDNSLLLLVGTVSSLLVAPLVIAAAMSQFSAAVADMLASTGNMEEVTHGHLKIRWAYLLVGGGAIALTWSADTFQIVALASRAFAFYYMFQCFVAISVSKTLIHKFLISLVALAMAFITLFAVPVG